MEQVLIPVARVEDLPDGGVIGVDVRGVRIAVFRVGRNYFALDALCPHEGGPLERGRLEGETVVCPWHLWRFNVRTGVFEGDSSICVRRYGVLVRKNELCIDFTEVYEGEQKWKEILDKLDSGEDPAGLSADFSVPVKEIEEADRRRRVGERLVWLGQLYREQGYVGGLDLLRMPRRDSRKVPYAVIPLIDELTHLL